MDDTTRSTIEAQMNAEMNECLHGNEIDEICSECDELRSIHSCLRFLPNPFDDHWKRRYPISKQNIRGLKR